jgi:hypothetical protein
MGGCLPLRVTEVTIMTILALKKKFVREVWMGGYLPFKSHRGDNNNFGPGQKKM